MTASDDTTNLKKCPRCEQDKPRTSEYFYRAVKRKDGFSPYCKACQSTWHKQYYIENKEAIDERNRQYIEANRDKTIAYRKQRYLANRDEVNRINQEWRAANPDRVKAQHQRWYIEHRQQSHEKSKRYRKQHPEYNKAAVRRYRAKKRGLPFKWTARDWRRCLEYFKHSCAVCGYPLRDVFGNVPHADHWIAITDKRPNNPGTVIQNMLCLCNSCNSSKSNKPPEAWLVERFGEKKALIISKRIADYFEWVKSCESA